MLLISHAYAEINNIKTINVGVTPAGIALTPDNHFAYVANNNNYGITGEDSVTVLNLKTNLPELTINDSSFNEPYTVTMNADGTRAYVTNSGGSTITVINTKTHDVIGEITGFDGPSGMVINPKGTRAYVNNYGGPILGSGNGTAVRVVDLHTNTIIGAPIIVDLAPAAIAMSPDGKFVYTINYVDGNPETVDYGNFWPEGTNLGHFYWEFWAMPGPDAGASSSTWMGQKKRGNFLSTFLPSSLSLIFEP